MGAKTEPESQTGDAGEPGLQVALGDGQVGCEVVEEVGPVSPQEVDDPAGDATDAVRAAGVRRLVRWRARGRGASGRSRRPGRGPAGTAASAAAAARARAARRGRSRPSLRGSSGSLLERSPVRPAVSWVGRWRPRGPLWPRTGTAAAISGSASLRTRLNTNTNAIARSSGRTWAALSASLGRLGGANRLAPMTSTAVRAATWAASRRITLRSRMILVRCSSSSRSASDRVPRTSESRPRRWRADSASAATTVSALASSTSSANRLSASGSGTLTLSRRDISRSGPHQDVGGGVDGAGDDRLQAGALLRQVAQRLGPLGQRLQLGQGGALGLPAADDHRPQHDRGAGDDAEHQVAGGQHDHEADRHAGDQRPLLVGRQPAASCRGPRSPVRREGSSGRPRIRRADAEQSEGQRDPEKRDHVRPTLSSCRGRPIGLGRGSRPRAAPRCS